MTEPGKTAQVCCWWDIERAIPSKVHPDLYKHYLALLEERKSARHTIIASILGDEDEILNNVCADERRELKKFVDTVPNTSHGVFRKMLHADALLKQDNNAFSDPGALIGSMATAVRSFLRT